MQNGTAPNAYRLLWAGFFAILAAGVGFSIRAGILADWAREFGFTMAELGTITGGGLTGFGIVILIGSAIADKVGYGRLMWFAFLLHLISAGLQLCTGPINEAFGRNGVYNSLFIAMFLFSIANGICEAVVNPMVATLFPREKTHYLNILHAGWPGGLIVGGLIAYLMNGGTIGTWEPFGKVYWLYQMALFLVPVFIYGALIVGQHFPKSEAGEAGVSYGTMLAEFASPLLLLLLLIHAMVGYVELGTDSWIGKITGSIMEDPKKGLLLFVYTSGLMFTLRFFAGPIVHKISPLGLLFVSAVCAAAGLWMLSSAVGIVVCVLAATVYGIGKTFFWPTMLAVVSEQFPRGGALTIGAVGGVGMLSAGLLGGPGIGFKQDHFASQRLREVSPQTYERYAAAEENRFLTFTAKGLDGSKVGVLEDGGADLARALEVATAAGVKNRVVEEQLRLNEWWQTAQNHAKEDEGPIKDASLYGGRQALRWTALVPATMAVLYLLIILYFQARGGYKPVELVPGGEVREKALV